MFTFMSLCWWLVCGVVFAIGWTLTEHLIRWGFNIEYKCPMVKKIDGIDYIVIKPKSMEEKNEVLEK